MFKDFIITLLLLFRPLYESDFIIVSGIKKILVYIGLCIFFYCIYYMLKEIIRMILREFFRPINKKIIDIMY